MNSNIISFRASSILLPISILMLFTGVLNAAFQSTPLAGWKQLLVIVAFMLVFHLTRQNRLLRTLLYSIMWASFFLIVSTLIRNASLVTAIYNIFFYVSWVPFFVWAAMGGVKEFQKKDLLIIVYLIIACVGLYVDLKTDYFSFLNIRDEVITIDYLETREIGNRAIFIFTASNLVMPIVSALLVLFLMHKHTMLRMCFCFAVLSLVIMTTGSTNSVLLAGFVASGMLYANARISIQTVFFIVLALIAYLLLSFNPVDISAVFGSQLQRILDNLTVGSEANRLRVILYENAFNDIGSFSLLDHITGAGLGCTNGNYNQLVLYGHGESSFLQAYIEGGALGLLLRLLPFVLAIVAFFKSKDRKMALVLVYCMGVFIVYALAPLFGNILSQMLLGMLVGCMYTVYQPSQAEQSTEANYDLGLRNSRVGLKS